MLNGFLMAFSLRSCGAHALDGDKPHRALARPDNGGHEQACRRRDLGRRSLHDNAGMKWDRWPARCWCSRKTRSRCSACRPNGKRSKRPRARKGRLRWRRLADAFEGAVGEIVETVSSASTQLEASAGTLSTTAERAQELTTMVAAASEEASTNVQSVASASEEMASSVNEIGRQVQESAKIAGEAVEQARRTHRSRQ